MTQLFVLIKRKGSKKYMGAIPVKNNVALSKIKKTISKSLRRGFSSRIVTKKQLADYIRKTKIKIKKYSRR